MPDPTQVSRARTEGRTIRGVAGSVWKRATPGDRYETLQLLSNGTPELQTEVLADRIAIKDQQLRVNADRHDPNPLSKFHR